MSTNPSVRPRFDRELIRRYNTSGPRYTSYPTALQFDPEFNSSDYRQAVERSNQDGGPLSLYVHIPFCDTVCFYCACNKIATKDRSKAEPYLQALDQEMAMQAELLDGTRVVDQLHFGGGTPTFLSDAQMRWLLGRIGSYFNLKTDDRGEYSIEIDPREADAATITTLRDIGFNRLSLGVQDFNPEVQKAINRIQSVEQTRTVVNAARDNDFHGISFDLIYGLPGQHWAGFKQTLEQVIELDPDRLSIFNYAHLPERFPPQRRIALDALPNPEEKLDILANTIEFLLQAGYVLIGMDHFAKPDDPLAIAQQNGTLQRNFQGYSTHAQCDMVAFGVSSISQVHDVFSQNFKTLDDYLAAIGQQQLPIEKGLRTTKEDALRRAVIHELICHFALDKRQIERQFDIVFDQHFADALQQLETMADDALVALEPDRIIVLENGRLLIRNICMAFDAYLNPQIQQRYSKVI